MADAPVPTSVPTTVLIVDDNAATRYAMRRVVERHGWRVLEAGTGAEGLALVESDHVDLLVLDVNLPDMSGFDVVRTLRRSPRARLLPIVHVTAASIHTRDMIAGLEGGADSYLIHPVDPGVLIATLRTLMRVRDAEEALRASERRQREIFAHVAAPIAVVDCDLHVLESNKAFDALHGAGGAALGMRLAPGQEGPLAQLCDSIRSGALWHGAIAARTGGEIREIEWRVVPYVEGQGLVFAEDVTRHRVRERQQALSLHTVRSQLAEAISAREATEVQLLQVQKMDALGQLTGGIAHDFNNLLTSIITSLGLLADEADNGRVDAVRQYADSAMGAARRAAALTHRLLAFARQQPLDARSVDVNARVASLQELLERTIGESIRLQIELEPRGAVARVDANQLENAILNLAVNARDALPQGGTIRIGTRLPDDAPGFVEVYVADDGTGIEEALLDKVFEPFFTTKPLGQGTGLGLSMTYGFARQSGGDVRIASTPGVGTTVALLLPVGDRALLPAPVAAEAASAPAGRGEWILLVEDDESVRELTATLLQLAGYRCLQAPDVERALDILRSDAPIDLLLSDLGLPGMDGRALADAARATRPTLQVLFLTGYARHAVELGGFLGQGMDMMTKPYEADALLARIGKMLHEGRAA